MQHLKIKAPAKLNLSLNVLPKIKKGYHQVKFLNTEIELADEIKIEKAKSGILVKCENADCYDKKCPQKCFAYQAAGLLKKQFPKRISGVKISIKKNIPSRAGLGGGSSDAAAVLKGLNKLFGLGLSQSALIKIAVKISTDACYSVVGGLCEVGGIGEKITPLETKSPCHPPFKKGDRGGISPKYYLLIVVPKIKKPSTKWCYENLDENKIGKGLDKYEELVLKLQVAGYRLKVTNYLHNDFESLILQRFFEVRKSKEKLIQLGAETAILAGSGLSVIGFFKNKIKMSNFKEHFRKYFVSKIL